MDYKEKYEALLANIKAYHARFGDTCNLKKELEECVPELRESKDDRIGNLVYCVIRDTPEVARVLSGNGVSVNDALTLLERLFSANKCKQDANNSANKPTNTAEDERMRKIITKFVWGYANTPGAIINGDKSVLEYAKEVGAYLENQKEQKPIPALDRGDEIILKAICEELKDAPGWIERIEGWYRLAKDAQQPAEWSEKDEKDIQEAADYLRDYANNCVQGGSSKLYLQGLADRVESLRPQPKQEWSEEDEKQLNWFYRLLDFIGEEFPSTWGQNRKGGKEWLKSLRPQPNDANNEIAWKKYEDGHRFDSDTVVIGLDRSEPRLVRCAVSACYGIAVKDLLKLPFCL